MRDREPARLDIISQTSRQLMPVFILHWFAITVNDSRVLVYFHQRRRLGQ